MQQFLKSPSGSAGAEVVAPEFLDEFFLAAHDAIAALNAAFRRITLASAYARPRKHGRWSKSSSHRMTRLHCLDGAPYAEGVRARLAKKTVRITKRRVG